MTTTLLCLFGSFRSFAATWQELVCSFGEKVAVSHMAMSTKLLELAKDVAAYHSAHKDGYKQVSEGSRERDRNYLNSLNTEGKKRESLQEFEQEAGKEKGTI